ncbi:MAG TPA: mRNA surveillance protein pelota [Verrucomicrobiae bacterium]|nr:mRNA surveillance protein pelota [Verrucomicrobiae bacterium]
MFLFLGVASHLRDVLAVKIIEKNLDQDFVKVVPDSPDDLWHLYNIIYQGDEVYAYSSRAIKTDTEASRPKSGERVSAFMGIKVISVSWDKFLGKLRIHGLICHAPDIIPKGAHHTLSIALNQPVTIVKKDWPKHAVDRLIRASETEKPMLILSIDDEGFAIAETKQYGVETRVEQRIRLPGKQEADKRVEATKAYFRLAVNSLNKLWTQNHNPIVIIGAGFVKNDFVKFLNEEAKEMSISIADVKSVNNGGTAGIDEALRSGVLLKAAHQLRVVDETETMEEVMKRLGKGEGTVTYGLDSVENAVKIGAVERLVLADTTLRDADEQQRLKLEALMREVEKRRANVTVISTEHEAGAKLLALGGIAALLRFPIYRDTAK